MTDQCHQLSNCSLDRKSFIALDPYRGTLGTKGREHDVRPVGFKYLADFIGAIKKNAINLSCRDGHILDEEAGYSDCLVDSFLGGSDSLGSITRNKDIARITTARFGGAVTMRLGEERREVNSRAGGGFNELDVLPMTPADDLMKRLINLDRVCQSTEL